MMRAIQEVRRIVAPVLAVIAVGGAGCDFVAPPPPTPRVIQVVVTATPTPVDGQPRPRPTETAGPLPPRTPTVQPPIGVPFPTQRPNPTDTPRPSPTATPRPASGEFRAATIKTPQQLYNDLLTTPFSSNKLPAGFTVKEISAGQLTPTAIALNAVGQVSITLLKGRDTAFLMFLVFRDESGAVGLFNTSPSATRIDNFTITLDQYPYSGCAIRTGNIVVTALEGSVGFGPQPPQQTQELLGLARAGVSHLQGVLNR